MNKSLYEKIYNQHIVYKINETKSLLYIDRHLMHEVTSPQAFHALTINNRNVYKPNKTFATMDHSISTKSKNIWEHNYIIRKQLNTLKNNCKKYKINNIYDINHPYQGIIHVIAPEQGIILPGMTIVCGDSHTCTHGAFGTLSFGIGTTEIEHVLATQTLPQNIFKTMKIEIIGNMPNNITAKDIALSIIHKLGIYTAIGHIIEFSGSIVDNLSMESRMTLCNMASEMGAKTGIIAPDNITYNYLYNRNFAPSKKLWNQAKSYWKTLKSDKNYKFNKTIKYDISNLEPQVTWGTHPSQVISINQVIPHPESFNSVSLQESAIKSLHYMNLKPGMSLKNIEIQKVFIGSCTNSRIEDLRSAAEIIKGKKISKKTQVIIVPGSNIIKKQAEIEELDKIFIEAGCEWRFPGCSMCLGMNQDKLNIGERCASTSNRNFEDRQGLGGRTHLVSPIMAAAAAISGCLIDVNEIIN